MKGSVGFIPALKREAFSSILRKSCVETYSYVVGEGDSSRCPDCAEEFNNLDRVGGSMRVRDEEERQKIASNIEDGEYGVFIDERVGDIWVCRE